MVGEEERYEDVAIDSSCAARRAWERQRIVVNEVVGMVERQTSKETLS